MASRSQTEQQQQSSLDIAEVLKDLELKMDRLKVLYEQYFMGIEKMEPQVSRKEVTRTMLQLQQQYIRNTAMRFKFNMMLQRWQLYVTYWNRTLREMENGTYVRHLRKAKRKAEKEGRELPAEMRFDKIRPPSGQFNLDEETQDSPQPFLDIDTGSSLKSTGPKSNDFDLEEVWDKLAPTEPKRGPSPAPAPAAAPARPAPPPPPSAARSSSVATPLPKRPPPPPTAAMLPKIPGMNENDLRSLHQRYVDAQKAAGAPAAVKYETLVNSLAKQVPTVLSKPGVKSVRFDVTVENGKPILKAIPQK
ncbi:MAG: MXAN_5187 C-terminal domain-containing protein [Polyangia bacterium]